MVSLINAESSNAVTDIRFEALAFLRIAGPMTTCANSGLGIYSFHKRRNATSNTVLPMPPSCLYMMAMDHILPTRCCILPKRTTLSSFDYQLIPLIALNHLMSVSSALFSAAGWRGVMLSWSPPGSEFYQGVHGRPSAGSH